jgi:cytochrome c oxidase subunit I+III
MFTTGLPGVTLAIFSAASMSVAIPTAIQIFCFLATLLAGRVARSAAMLYIIGGLSTFVIGGLTGVMVAMAPFNFQAHDTYFVVAHLHTVLIAGAVFPVVAGLYYYYPLALGKQLSERLGRVSFWLVFIGFNATFLPMHLTGLMGLPRRVFTYPAGLGLDPLNLLSTIGAFVLAAGFAVVAWDVVRPKRRQPYAARNPWDAGTVEWLQEIPGRPWGVRTIPFVERRYPMWETPGFLRDYDAGAFFLPDAEEGRREMLVTSSIDAEPIQCMRIPGPTYITLFAAIAVGGMFIFPTFKMYSWMGVSAVFSLIAIVIWLWTGTGEIPEKDTKAVGRGVTLPLYASGRHSAGWWAMGITMIAIFSAFISLVFGYFFYWTLRENFIPADARDHALWAVIALVATLAAWASTVLARKWNAADRAAAFYAGSAFGVVTAIAGGAALLAHPYFSDFDPTHGVYPAVVWLLAIWSALHLAIGAIMQLYCMARRFAGRMTATYDMDIVNVVLYWHFTMLTAAITLAINAGIPYLV